MIDSFEAQELISQHRPDNAAVICTMTANFEWPQVTGNADLDLPFSGAMGKASSVGLGLALARPDLKVIVLDADGSLLMNLGSLITVANMAPANLVHFVFQNGVYRTTGGQPVPGTDKISFADMARAAGYPRTYVFSELSELQANIDTIIGEAGPTFVCLKVPAATERPPYPLSRMSVAIDRFRAGLAKSLVHVSTRR